jgi:Fur family peroxide stress response transcriptional regulator
MENRDRAERLRGSGLVPTAQRLAVLSFLEGTKSHPTAEETYAGVKRRFASISRATVYNALEALKRAGAVSELTIAREVAHYDAGPPSHPHFLCRSCGELYDLELPCALRPGDEVLGHRIEAVQMSLYGVCRTCQDAHEIHS